MTQIYIKQNIHKHRTQSFPRISPSGITPVKKHKQLENVKDVRKGWLVSQLVGRYFEPSQPQRITSRPKTMFNLSPVYSARKSSNHKLSPNHKISPTQTRIKQKIYKHQTQNFRSISSFGITPVKKAHKAWTRWYHGPFRRFINIRSLKKSI